MVGEVIARSGEYCWPNPADLDGKYLRESLGTLPGGRTGRG